MAATLTVAEVIDTFNRVKSEIGNTTELPVDAFLDILGRVTDGKIKTHAQLDAALRRAASRKAGA